MFASQAELTEMKTTNSRLQREMNEMSNKMQTLEKQNNEKDTDLLNTTNKLEQITNDVIESVDRDVESGAATIVTLKKIKRELENKIDELEDEIDTKDGKIDNLITQKER